MIKSSSYQLNSKKKIGIVDIFFNKKIHNLGSFSKKKKNQNQNLKRSLVLPKSNEMIDFKHNIDSIFIPVIIFTSNKIVSKILPQILVSREIFVKPNKRQSHILH